MEARKLDFMQKATIIPFKREIDMTLANIANEKAENTARENAARNYSAGCKRNSVIDKEDIMCFLSGLSVFAIIVAMYFIGIIL